jgi:hypothetical protein
LGQLLHAARERRAAPRRLSVREAWLAHERYVGQSVVLDGVLRAFEAGTSDEYFTIDDGPHRVGLRGDAATLRGLIGQPVRATGQIVFKPGVGIFLVAETIARAT